MIYFIFLFYQRGVWTWDPFGTVWTTYLSRCTASQVL